MDDNHVWICWVSKVEVKIFFFSYFTFIRFILQPKKRPANIRHLFSNFKSISLFFKPNFNAFCSVLDNLDMRRKSEELYPSMKGDIKIKIVLF